MAEGSIVAVILNWRRADDTIRCVRSLDSEAHELRGVIVVDNHSGDSSAAQIARACPDVRVIQAPANLGYAGGNNLGIAAALEQGAPYVLILNNDVEVEPGALRLLRERLEGAPRLGQVGPLVLDETGRTVGWVGGTIVWSGAETRSIGHGEPDDGQFAELTEVDFIPGTAVLVRSSALREAGPIPDDYFLYFEDVAWSLEFRARGWSCGVEPAARVRHRESSSTGAHSPLKSYYYARNNLVFARRYGPAAFSMWRLRYRLLRLVARETLSLRPRNVLALAWGVLDAWRGRMGPGRYAPR